MLTEDEQIMRACGDDYRAALLRSHLGRMWQRHKDEAAKHRAEGNHGLAEESERLAREVDNQSGVAQ